ncbi:MAG: OmpA family protein [Bacteroidales bacterium]
MRLLTIVASVFIVQLFYVQAQDNPEQLPALYVDSTGQVYTQADAPAYIFISPANEDDKLVKSPSSDKAANPMQWDGHGVHYIAHRDVVQNKIVRFKVLADGVAPNSGIDFESGLLFHINQNYFAEVGATVVPNAQDGMSGVGKTYASVNNEPFKLFEEPIAFNTESEYSLRIYSVDNVGNKEDPKEFIVHTSPDAVVNMDNIFFGLNSAELSQSSKVELNKLASLMKRYKDIHLEIRAHSDSRGNADYNMELSEQRAQAAVAYLKSRGVPEQRLKSKGYGETMLLNECAEGISCPEEKHRVNRRVEFIVSKMN